MIRDELRRKRWYVWLAQALAFAFVLWAGCVGTIVVFSAVAP